MGAGQETPKSSDRAVLRLTVSRQLDCNIAGLHGAKNLIDQISTTTELRRVRNAVCASNFPAERAFIARKPKDGKFICRFAKCKLVRLGGKILPREAAIRLSYSRWRRYSKSATNDQKLQGSFYSAIELLSSAISFT